MENRKFDDFIKQSLEHLDGGKYIPMDWSSMNEQMNTDSLDDAMKGSLENLEQDYINIMEEAIKSQRDG